MTDEKMTDDGVLEYTQRLRKQLVTDMTKKGMPDDPKDRSTMLMALSDMDRAALGNKRITKDEQIASEDRAAQAAIARVYSTLGNKNPFEVQPEKDITPVVPELPENIAPDAEFVEGEEEIGVREESYQEFAERTGM